MNWKDAYEAQMDLWKWVRTREGMDQMFSTIDILTLPERSRPLFAQLLRAEDEKLLGADPIFVADEFCTLCEQAQHGFKPEPVLASDFLTPQGFLFYETPIPIPTRDPAWRENLAGFSWTPLMFDKTKEPREFIDGLPLTLDEADILGVENEHMMAGGMALTLYCVVREEDRDRQYADGRPIRFPHIVPMHLTPWYFGMTYEGNDVDLEGNETAVEIWWRLCQVTLRLMQQKLAARTHTQVERASRRRGERLGFSPRETVVVRLRRHKSAPTESERDVQWTHRWYSKGYWRNTWYASIQAHRQQYVAGSIKGPDGLPLIIKPRAYQWEE